MLNNIRAKVEAEIYRHYGQKGIAHKVSKELVKVRQATQFIGQGSPGSSTAVIAAAWGELANTGKYVKDDIIMMAANGNRRGSVIPIVNGQPNAAYRLIIEAAKAGARFVIDKRSYRENSRYNSGEQLLAAYLMQIGYEEQGDTGVFAKMKTPSLAGTSDGNAQPSMKTLTINTNKEDQAMNTLNTNKEFNMSKQTLKQNTETSQAILDALTKSIPTIDELNAKFEFDLITNSYRQWKALKEVKAVEDFKLFTAAVYNRHRTIIRNAYYEGLRRKGFSIRQSFDREEPTCQQFKHGVDYAERATKLLFVAVSGFNEHRKFAWFNRTALTFKVAGTGEMTEGEDRRYSTQVRTGGLDANPALWVEVDYDAVKNILHDKREVFKRVEIPTFNEMLELVKAEFANLTKEELAQCGFESADKIPHQLVVEYTKSRIKAVIAANEAADEAHRQRAIYGESLKKFEEETPYREYIRQFDISSLVGGVYSATRAALSMDEQNSKAMKRLAQLLGEKLMEEIADESELIWDATNRLFKHLVALRKVVDANSSATRRYQSIIKRLRAIEKEPEGSDYGIEFLDQEDDYGFTNRQRKEDYEAVELAYTELLNRIDANTWAKLQNYANEAAQKAGFEWVDVRPAYWMSETHAEIASKVGGFETVQIVDKETGELKTIFGYKFKDYADFNTNFSSLLNRISRAWAEQREADVIASEAGTSAELGKLKGTGIKKAKSVLPEVNF